MAGSLCRRLLGSAALFALGCQAPTELPRVARVLISPAALELLGGDSAALAAVALDEAGESLSNAGPVLWTSRNSALVRVSTAGKVTADTVSGTTFVLATISQRSDSVSVRVLKPAVFYVWPDTSAIAPGMTRQLRMKEFSVTNGVRVATGAETWLSSEPAVAAVNDSGLITAKAVGNARISATVDGRTRTAEVFVFEYPAALRFSQLSMGSGHVCGLTTGGDAYCWGSNDAGQLGTPTVTDRCEDARLDPKTGWSRTLYRCSGIPRRVASPESLRSVEATEQGACALGASNVAYCWGSSLGLAAVGPTLLPGPQFQSISSYCGIGVNGLGHCWGGDSNGERGDGPGRTTGYTASAVANGKAWSAISSRGAVCALDVGGVPYCWGASPVTGTQGPVSVSCFIRCIETPTAVQVDPRYADVRFTQIVGTGEHNCALAADGRLFCWGGDEGRTIGIVPALSQPIGGLVSISAPVDFSPGHVRPICGVTGVGAVYCAYYSRTAGPDSAFALVSVNVGVALKSVVHRERIGCGIGTDQLAYCWDGGNSPSMMGNGSLSGPGLPQPPTRVVGQ